MALVLQWCSLGLMKGCVKSVTLCSLGAQLTYMLIFDLQLSSRRGKLDLTTSYRGWCQTHICVNSKYYMEHLYGQMRCLDIIYELPAANEI